MRCGRGGSIARPPGVPKHSPAPERDRVSLVHLQSVLPTDGRAAYAPDARRRKVPMTSPRAVAALLLLFAGSAGAHDTWLLPETFSVAPGAELVFELTSGGEFPALDTAIEPERVARAAYRV